MTARQTTQRFRQRKLSTKQNLTIVRETDIDPSILDDEAQRNIPKIKTGVEEGEEIVRLFFFFYFPCFSLLPLLPLTPLVLMGFAFLLLMRLPISLV